MPSTNKGTPQLSPHIILKDVLCVPTFKLKLVSMGKLNLQNSCFVVVGITTCITQELASKMMIGLAKWRKGLFVLDFNPATLETYSSSPTVSCTSLSDSVSRIPFDDKEVPKFLCHYRLGHLSFPCLQKL